MVYLVRVEIEAWNMALLAAWSMRVNKYGFTHGVVKGGRQVWLYSRRGQGGSISMALLTAWSRRVDKYIYLSTTE